MFFLKWLIGLIVALVINSGLFALSVLWTDFEQEPHLIAAISTFLAGAIFLVVLFPPAKKKKR